MKRNVRDRRRDSIDFDGELERRSISHRSSRIRPVFANSPTPIKGTILEEDSRPARVLLPSATKNQVGNTQRTK